MIKIEDIKQEREDVGANDIKSIQQINPIVIKEEKKIFDAVDNYCINCFKSFKVKVRHIQGYKCIKGQPEPIQKFEQNLKIRNELPEIFMCFQCNKRCYSKKQLKKHKAKFHTVYCSKSLSSIKDNLEEFTKKYTTALNDTNEEIKFNIQKNLKTYSRKNVPMPLKVKIKKEPKCLVSDSISDSRSKKLDPELTNDIKFEIKEEFDE